MARPSAAPARTLRVLVGAVLRAAWDRPHAAKRRLTAAKQPPTPREARRPTRHEVPRMTMALKRIRTVVAAIAVAIVTMPSAAPAAASLAQLSGMSELKGWFNAHKGRPRLILLLSPT